jgi:hypothetical protein
MEVDKMASINIDWSEELKDCEKWVNHGRVAIEEGCTHKTQDKYGDTEEDKETNMRYSGYCEECGHYEDTASPMMNFGHILDIKPDEEEILEVVNETNCTIMENTETGEYFIVLCGCGMDLSQDIALAYIVIQKHIPIDLINSICKQKGLSQSEKNFERIRKSIIETIDISISNLQRTKKEWSDLE